LEAEHEIQKLSEDAVLTNRNQLRRGTLSQLWLNNSAVMLDMNCVSIDIFL